MGVLASADCSDRVNDGLFALVVVGLLGLVTDLAFPGKQAGAVACCVACMYLLGASMQNATTCSVVCVNGAVCLVILIATRAAMLMPRQGKGKEE
jgi:hypothetical protein